MAVTKLTISLPEDLAETVRDEAAHEAATVSAWITTAVRAHLLRARQREAVTQFQAEHGEFTESETAGVDRWIEKGWAEWRSRSTPGS